MANEETYDSNQDYMADFNVKIRDIEEKQNLLKDRVVLIGENFITEKEDMDEEFLKIKAQLNNLTEEIRKIKLAIQRLVDSQENFARKSEVQILENQFKMFQPLEFARMKDVKEMIKEAIEKKA